MKFRFVTVSKNFLRLPKDKIAIFTSMKIKVYAYVKHQADQRENLMKDWHQ
jgi:membrane-bound lytic murein transglycosylase D